MYRYRFIGTPVVFANEVVNGHTWEPGFGDEAEFDHPIDHAFLELVATEITESPVVDEAEDTAVDGDDSKES